MVRIDAARISDEIRKERWSEKEAREIGFRAQKVQQLRDLLKCDKPGKLTIETAFNSTTTIILTPNDVAALLHTLIERESAFLIGMNVEMER